MSNHGGLFRWDLRYLEYLFSHMVDDFKTFLKQLWTFKSFFYSTLTYSVGSAKSEKKKRSRFIKIDLPSQSLPSTPLLWLCKELPWTMTRSPSSTDVLIMHGRLGCCISFKMELSYIIVKIFCQKIFKLKFVMLKVQSTKFELTCKEDEARKSLYLEVGWKNGLPSKYRSIANNYG